MKSGRWYLEDGAVMTNLTKNFTYDISLILLRTPERREEWVLHMAEKSWVSPDDIIDLRAFLDNLVSMGYL